MELIVCKEYHVNQNDTNNIPEKHYGPRHYVIALFVERIEIGKHTKADLRE